MKKFVAGGNSNNKLFEVAYIPKSDDTVGISYTSVAAKDVIEAAEIIMSMFNVTADKIEYVTERKSESIIA